MDSTHESANDPEYAFPRFLCIAMKKQGFGFKELCQKTGIKQSTLYGWSGGVRPRDILQVYKVAKALNLTIEELIFGNPRTPENVGYELVLYRISPENVREVVTSLPEARCIKR